MLGVALGALYSTVGVHPTRCDELDENGESHLTALLEIAQRGKEIGKVVAIGECGLGITHTSVEWGFVCDRFSVDYDRLQFCSKETQLVHFAAQFWLTEQTHLPMLAYPAADLALQ